VQRSDLAEVLTALHHKKVECSEIARNTSDVGTSFDAI
jgi:hypothetical protein